LTYNGQGVNKRGIIAKHHAIIYSGKRPIAFKGEKEKGLQFRAIRAKLDAVRDRLDDASRLNYAKQYTIEYNVKVWFIGSIFSDFEWQLRTDYNRIHPPLEIKGFSPPGMSDDADVLTYYPASSHIAPNYQHVESEYRGANSSSQYLTTDFFSPELATSYSNPYIAPAYNSTSERHSINTIPDEAETQQTRSFSADRPDQDLEIHLIVNRQEEDTEPQTLGGHPDSPADFRDQYQDPKNNSENESILPSSSGPDEESAIPLDSRSRITLSHPAKTVDDQDSTSSSSTESSRSDKPSRASSASSWSADNNPNLIHQYLVDIIRQDVDVQAICDQAFHKPTWDQFEKNLRHCLLELSQGILIEIQSRQGIQAAQAIRRFAKSAAKSIKGTLELQEAEICQRIEEMHRLKTRGDADFPDFQRTIKTQEWTHETIQRTEEMYRPATQVGPYVQENLVLQEWTKEAEQRAAEMHRLSTQTDAYAEESDDDDDDDIEPIDACGRMAEFNSFRDLVISSLSFQTFKERFDLSVNPAPARSAICQLWPKLASISSLQLLSYEIEWELELFVDNHVKDPNRIGDLIILTGHSVDAEAICSRDYLSWAWPAVGCLLLEGIELLLLHESSRKSPHVNVHRSELIEILDSVYTE
jgi:hypothetical protein